MSELPQPASEKTVQLDKEKPAGPKRFVEKGPHAVLDTKTGVVWMKKDSWQEKRKFFNWHESKDFAEAKNLRKFGGFADWRLPSKDEALMLFDPEKQLAGKGGVVLHMDPIFPEGAFRFCWLSGDTSTRRPRFDYESGEVVSVHEYSFGAVRLCRKGPANADPRRPQRP